LEIKTIDSHYILATVVTNQLMKLHGTVHWEINNQFIKLYLNRRDEQPVHHISP